MSLEVEVVVVVVICVVIVVFLYGRSFHKTSLSIFSKFNKMSESSFSQNSEIFFSIFKSFPLIIRYNQSIGRINYYILYMAHIIDSGLIHNTYNTTKCYSVLLILSIIIKLIITFWRSEYIENIGWPYSYDEVYINIIGWPYHLDEVYINLIVVGYFTWQHKH